jgi:hypothetical protein
MSFLSRSKVVNFEQNLSCLRSVTLLPAKHFDEADPVIEDCHQVRSCHKNYYRPSSGVNINSINREAVNGKEKAESVVELASDFCREGVEITAR